MAIIEGTTTTRSQRGRGDFLFLEELGEGSFSTVHLASEKTSGQRYAVKVLSKAHIIREKKVKEVFREKDVLRLLSAEGSTHPNVIQLYCTFQDESSLYFVLTYASQKDLARFVCAEIVSALGHIHTLNIVHRDLKPENILIKDDGHIMLSDFGCSKQLLGEIVETNMETEANGPMLPKRRSSFVGSPPYVPPEVLSGGEVTTAIDYWTLGVTLYELLCSHRPFSDASEYLTYKRILSLRYSFPESFMHPPAGKDLVKRLLVLSPAARIGAQENGGAEAVKHHEFLAEIDWERLQNKPSPLL